MRKLKFGKILSALVASAGLGAFGAADCASSDLIHRWSFTGNYDDSVGGITATTFGSVAFNDADNPTAARVSGTAKDTAYIKLGAGIVPAESSPVTFEIWGTQHSVKNWSRIFSFGADSSNYLMMSWTTGTDANTERVEIKKGGTALVSVSNTLKPYTLNQPFHISITMTPNGDGKTTLAWAKRDVNTGAVLASGGATTSADWDPSLIASYGWSCLGRSQYSDSDADASYDEMRVWKAALTEEQLSWSAKLGPDALPVEEVTSTPSTLTLTSENGTVTVNGTTAVGSGAVSIPRDPDAQLTAVPADGYVFVGWTGDTQYVLSGDLKARTITINSARDVALTANFVPATATYARYVSGQFSYLSPEKTPVEAPEGGMNGDITILFSSDAEYQGLKSLAEDVAKAKGLELEANVKLDTDTDWTQFGYSLGGNAIDINGKHFTTGSLKGEGGIASDGNIVQNGGFQEDSVVDGGYVVINPKGWRTSGTIALIKNNREHGDTQFNGSNWCLIWSGAYVYRDFAVVEPGTYTFKFTIASHNNTKTVWGSDGYASIDGVNIIANKPSWTSSAKSATVELGVGVHQLKIGCSSNSALLVDEVSLYKNSNSATPGILEVKVPEGQIITNSTVLIGGGHALQLWKTGKGELRMNRANNGYGSPFGDPATVVKEGIVCNAAGGATCGMQYARIQVEDGGSFDINARAYHDYYFTLCGAGSEGLGALTNRKEDGNPSWTNGNGFMRDLVMVGDTTIGGTKPFSLAFYNSTANYTAMNGYTLTLSGTTIYSGSMSFNGKGKVVVAPTGRYVFSDFYQCTPSMADSSFEVQGVLEANGYQISVFSNLIFTATGKFCNAKDSRPSSVVLAKYAPNLTAVAGSKVTHPTITLGSEASLRPHLDLSLFTEPFDASTTTFFSGTSVTVEFGERELADNEKVVSWSAAPVADFIPDGANVEGVRLLAKDDGLYVVRTPAWAEWDLVNDCWIYFSANGQVYPTVWEDGITDQIDVHFSSVEEFNAIKTKGVTPAKFLLTKLVLTPGSALYDFSDGFDFFVQSGTVIDLKGNQLKLPASVVGGAVPFTVTDSSAAAVPAITTQACFWLDAFDASTMKLDSSNKVLEWTSKDASHVVATAVAAPTYNSRGYAIPTVDFGAAGSTLDMSYPRFSNLRTIFWVMKIVKSETAFLLGDTENYNFHRGSGGQYGNGSYHKFSSIWNGLDPVNITADAPSDTEFRVYSATMSVNANSDRLTTDRNCTSGNISRSGGRQLSELICFDSVLSDADRTTITQYLQQKWFGTDGCGELIVEVPEGQTIANTSVTIAGRAKFVKTGAGTFNANRTNQSYNGGTVVDGGQFTVINNTGLGANGREVTVNPDGVLEMNGVYDMQNYNFVLAGGTMQNTKTDIDSGKAQIANVRLTADSTFKSTCSYGFINGGYAAAKLDLGGHTLKVNVGDDKNFWFYNVTVTEGTVDLTGGGWLRVDKTAVTAPNTTFRVNCALGVAVPFTVGGYEACYGVADKNEGAGVMTVNQVFKPCNACYRGVTLADGATLDLSGFSGVFTGTSAFTAGSNAVTYPTGTEETGAKMFVELHGRALTQSQIVSWEAVPAYLTVKETERTRADGRFVITKDNGLFVVGGTVLLFR